MIPCGYAVTFQILSEATQPGAGAKTAVKEERFYDIHLSVYLMVCINYS
jgi:hypothetical protein